MTNTDLSVSIIPFENRYAGDFASLNYEWLLEYFEIEAHDREVLDHPYEQVIQPGGMIFFALLDQTVVGTVALIVEDETSYELAKMCVSPEYKGLKIGQMLMDHAIEYARKNGKSTLILESNTKLTPAISLYEKSGFVKIPANPCSPYTRCNIRMKLNL